MTCTMVEKGDYNRQVKKIWGLGLPAHHWLLTINNKEEAAPIRRTNF